MPVALPGLDAGGNGSGRVSKWAEMVARIRDGDQAGMEELYALFSRGVRFYLCRHLGAEDLEDRIHDTFLIVVQAIRRGDLRDPDRLMGFVRTIVRRQVAAYIERSVQMRKAHADVECGLTVTDARCDPERDLMTRQNIALMERVLCALGRRDREILTRFYLQEQTQEQVCREMNLTETQFRLLKSRAKLRFGELGRRRLRGAIRSIFGRGFRGSGH